MMMMMMECITEGRSLAYSFIRCHRGSYLQLNASKMKECNGLVVDFQHQRKTPKPVTVQREEDEMGRVDCFS